MRLLDLYCGAGLASDGYHQAGFEIIGVDIEPQPDYPYTFVQADAKDAISVLADEVDVIHASPPCQSHTRAKHLARAQGHKTGKRWDDDFLWMLDHIGLCGRPYFIENVPGVPVAPDFILCGSMFGLKVRRHRWFWSSELVLRPRCDHQTQGRPVGVYHVMGDEIPHGGRTAKTLQEGLDAMGVDRNVPWGSLKEGIPPAYTRWIGEQFIAATDRGRTHR